MDQFARIVVGYHGCRTSFAESLLLGRTPIFRWKKSENSYDWLGNGIYFWEHSASRALHWALQRYGRKRGAVVGAVIQLGACFDLLDEDSTRLLADSYRLLRKNYQATGRRMPRNRGAERKFRQLDCAVINTCLSDMEEQDIRVDTTRGAFLEGKPIFPGTTISSETHIQIAVRNIDCILGVFRPNIR